MPNTAILEQVYRLIDAHKKGLLGGEVMPEDARPSIIQEDSAENYLFLTLPMALNYQRNSYALWESAAKAFLDPECSDVFKPHSVCKMSEDTLRQKLLKHKVALQPNKHIATWLRISEVLCHHFEGDVRVLLDEAENDILLIRELVQRKYKKQFPYLSGPKIFNYWLYVLESYTPTRFNNRFEISVAPDTHVIQASVELGLIDKNAADKIKSTDVAKAWHNLLMDEEIAPIDIHTPLWLWSRKGLPPLDAL